MLSVGLIMDNKKSLSHLLGLGLDRFQIEIVLSGNNVAEVVSRPEFGKVDIWMTQLAGTAAASWRTLTLGSASPSQPRPLVMVCDGTDAQLADALENGASAIILPDDTAFDAAASVHAAACRELFISPRLLRRLDRRLTEVLTAELPRSVLLTDREERVLALMADGNSNAAIGRSLHISPATVSTHVGKILRKLGVRNRTEAVTAAWGMALLNRTPQQAERNNQNGRHEENRAGRHNAAGDVNPPGFVSFQ